MRVAIVPVVISAIACSSSDNSSGTDSTLNTVPVWQIDSAPRVVIGNSDDSIAQSWLVASAKYYPETQTVVVADSARYRLHVYDAKTGSKTRSFGRRGKGPGDILSLSLVRYFGDTVMVVDRFNERVSMWSDQGFLRTRPLPSVGSAGAQLATILSTGEAVGFTVNFCPRLGQVSDTADFVVVDSSGKTTWKVGKLYAGESFYTPVEKTCNGDGTPMAAGHFVAPAAEGFWYANGTTRNVARFSRRGELEDTVQLPVAFLEPTEEDRKYHIDRWVNENPDSLAIRQRLAAQPHITLARNLPVVYGMIPTRDGGVWVGVANHARDATRDWYVLSPAGQIRGRVTVPVQYEIMEANDHYIVAKVADANEHTRVVVLDVRNGSNTPS